MEVETMGVQSIDAEDDQFAYRYDTQLLIDRRDEDLDEDAISEYITEHYEGNSLIVAGDEDLVKIHFHTNEPWKVLAYCNTIGEIYDIVIEDMTARRMDYRDRTTYERLHCRKKRETNGKIRRVSFVSRFLYEQRIKARACMRY